MAQGVTQGKIILIRKKLAKDQTVEQIAEALEESVETIELLIKEHNLI